jgi:DNA-binding NarL/FixJ family response regulator/signal transduction histidine kinase
MTAAFIPGGALGGRLRAARERLRLLLDPPDTGRDPGPLARWLERMQTFNRTRVLVTDSAVAFAVFAVSLLSDRLARGSVSAGLLTFLLAIPLVWRRRAPVTVFGVIAVMAFAQWLAGFPLVADVALLAALYTLAAHRPRRVAAAGFVILECGAVLAAGRWGASAMVTFVSLSGAVVAALVTGLYVRARRAHVASLVERAAHLEFERDQQALLAATAERARISREMHDVVAHSLAVVISLAGGATAKLGSHPEQSREALESISELGRQALADTRRLLSVLGAEENVAVRAPQPGLEQIADLVDHAAATGLVATLSVRGDPVPVAAGPALAAYRIVQEAITNTVKHAEGAESLTVMLAWTPCCLQIAVTDDGHGARRSAGSAGGFGLAGHARARRPLRRHRNSRSQATRRMGSQRHDPGHRAGLTVDDGNAPGASVSVILVDDQPLLRKGFRMVLEEEEGIDVVGEASDGAAALDLARRCHPDIVVMDVRMPGMDGIAATRAILAAEPRTRILILTTFDLDDYAFGALRLGASGFILKDILPSEFVQAIRSVASGDAVIAPSVTRRLLNAFAHQIPDPQRPEAVHPELNQLTAREREILTELASGLSNAEIAERLCVAEATVKTHLGRTLTKTGTARPGPGSRLRLRGRPRWPATQAMTSGPARLQPSTVRGRC